MTKKTELSIVVRVNSVFEGADSLSRTMELVRKVRGQVDRLAKEPGVSAVNMDYTTSASDDGVSLG